MEEYKAIIHMNNGDKIKVLPGYAREIESYLISSKIKWFWKCGYFPKHWIDDTAPSESRALFFIPFRSISYIEWPERDNENLEKSKVVSA